MCGMGGYTRVFETRVKGEGIPGYLKKGWEESRWQRAAWFRLRNEMRGENYWEKEKRKKCWCRLCEGGLKTWTHVWEDWDPETEVG